MKEGVDFIKIKDYAVINLNNMIPVPDSQIVDIDINKEKNASYRYLLQAESREVNRQKNRVPYTLLVSFSIELSPEYTCSWNQSKDTDVEHKQ